MNDTLQHHGVPGQKWGVRRYQNKDGSLTPAGKKRADKIKSKYSKLRDEYTGLTGKRLMKKPTPKTAEQNKPKTIKEMSDTELQTKINRIRKEQEYASLQPQRISRGKKFMISMRDNVIAPAAKEAGKRVLTDYLTKVGKDLLKLNPEADPTAKLKREVETLELERRKTVAQDFFEKRKKKN